MGPSEINEYKSLAINAVPTTIFSTGMLRTVINIENFSNFYACNSDRHCFKFFQEIFHELLNLLCNSITEDAIESNERVGIRCHIEELISSEINLSTKDSTLIVNSSLLIPDDSMFSSLAISFETRISPSGYLSIHS